MKKITCKTALKKNLISKAVYDREVKLCQQLNEESGGKGCNWGRCKVCGVLPLLMKLHKGVLIEDKEELGKIKKEIFGY